MSRRPRVTLAQRAEILAAYAAGHSYRQVAEALDLGSDAVGRVVRAAGLARRPEEGLALWNAALSDETRATLREAGRRGGAACKATHGAEHYRRAGARGGGTTASRYGSDYYARIGRAGGRRTAATHGRAFYEEIGLKGAARLRHLLALGRETEERG